MLKGMAHILENFLASIIKAEYYYFEKTMKIKGITMDWAIALL
jgi:hypothetical protein